jgi:hypothetical protein
MAGSDVLIALKGEGKTRREIDLSAIRIGQVLIINDPIIQTCELICRGEPVMFIASSHKTVVSLGGTEVMSNPLRRVIRPKKKGNKIGTEHVCPKSRGRSFSVHIVFSCDKHA